MALENKQQLEILRIVNKHKQIKQPDLVNIMMKNNEYKNKVSARNSVGMMVRKLEVENYLRVDKVPTEGRGGLRTNLIIAK